MRGLAFRIGLVMIGTLVIVIAIASAIGIVNWRNTALGVALPEPARVGAIADLVEATPAADLPQVIRALNSPELTVTVDQTPPANFGTRRMPGLTLAFNAYREALKGRPVRVMLDLEGDTLPRGLLRRRGRLWAAHPIRLVVGLNDGRSLVLEARSALTQQFTGLRISLLALLVALILGGVSLFVLRRQIRPIEGLAEAVQRFGADMKVSPMPETGAREVRQLTAAFNRLQSQIAALIAGRTRMIAAISHDLGTYLTRLRLRTNFISDADQRERAVRDIEDMHALMSDTLAMAKLDHDSEAAETMDLAALARRVAQRFESSGKVTVVAAETVRAKVRPSVFGRVFDNLIANALKYGNEAEVTISRVGDKAEILVDDRGPGIPAAEREAVLEPFYRRDNARNLDERGFGLGLAIVADIVKRHDGSLSLEDRSGGGLRVRIRLPLAETT